MNVERQSLFSIGLPTKKCTDCDAAFAGKDGFQMCPNLVRQFCMALCSGQPALSLFVRFIMSMTFHMYVLLTVLGEGTSCGCIGGAATALPRA